VTNPPDRDNDPEAFRLIDQFVTDLSRLAGDGEIPASWRRRLYEILPAPQTGDEIPPTFVPSGATGSMFGIALPLPVQSSDSAAAWRAVAEDAVELARAILDARRRETLASALANWRRGRGRPRSYREPTPKGSPGRPKKWSMSFCADVLRTIEGIQRANGLAGRGKDKAAAEIYIRRWAKKNGRSEAEALSRFLKRMQKWISESRNAIPISKKNIDIY
jgi:hypothetical protein